MRPITPEDEPQAVEMMMAYFIEAAPQVPLDNRGRFSMDYFKTRQSMNRILNSPNLIGFIDDNGMILGELAETIIGPDIVANGGIWYVRPQARGGLLAWRLLKAFDQEASKKAICARMDLDNPTHTGIIERMYVKAGFKPYSRIWVKEF